MPLAWLKAKMMRSPLYGRSVARLANALSSNRIPEFLIGLTPVSMNQAWPSRAAVMRREFASYLQRPVRALEIGTWFGQGSTRLLLELLPSGSELTLIDSWRPYISARDHNQGLNTYRLMDQVHHAAINSTLNRVYAAEAQGKNIEINLIRGKSANVLTSFQSHQFDFIYVDGSHYYADVKADLEIVKRLAKPDAMICGDDYDIPPSSQLLQLARQHLDADYITSPDGIGFHPGVVLAVTEAFEAVNMESGFWWLYVRDGRFATKN